MKNTEDPVRYFSFFMQAFFRKNVLLIFPALLFATGLFHLLNSGILLARTKKLNAPANAESLQSSPEIEQKEQVYENTDEKEDGVESTHERDKVWVRPRFQKSFFAPPRDPNRPRNVFAGPIISFILPGFDQWWEGQYTYASLYTGVGLASASYGSFYNQKYQKSEEAKDTASEEDTQTQENRLASRDNLLRKALLGSQLTMAMGSFSAYHSFRTAVASQRAQGDYSFLPSDKEEKPLDVLMSPFNFRYLARSTTFIPLGILAGISALTISSGEYHRRSLGSDDLFFASAFSTMAGTHEEALFRGYLMPVAREYTGSDLLSNGISAGAFAAAHLSSNPRPLPQLALGLYFGYLSQENSWTLGESAFIHAWWDFIIFATVFHLENLENSVVKQRRPPLWLPPLEWTF